jgi:hypothetical protein
MRHRNGQNRESITVDPSLARIPLDAVGVGVGVGVGAEVGVGAGVGVEEPLCGSLLSLDM